MTDIPRSGASSEPLVSVIVPVRNGNHYLTTLMRALSAQTLPKERFEVVIVDDGSREAPLEFATEDEHIRVLPGPQANSYAARNRGVAASRGSLLAFCDADCVPEPEWLEKGVAALADNTIVAGRIRFIVPQRRTVWTLIDMDTSKNQKLLVSKDVAETANLFVHKSDFLQVGGFDAVIREHGDYDFAERSVGLGRILRYADDVVVWHPTRMSSSEVLRAHWIYCRGYAERAAATSRPVEGLKLRAWVPIVGVMRERRRTGLALTVATSWLAQNDVRPTMRERALSLPVTYLLLPYARNIAQIVGAIDGASHRAIPTAADGERL